MRYAAMLWEADGVLGGVRECPAASSSRVAREDDLTLSSARYGIDEYEANVTTSEKFELGRSCLSTI